MEEKRLLTILTPAYNKAATFQRTFDSLLRQTCHDFEWVIVNDGSTDGTKEIIDTFHTDLFPVIVKHKENEGLCKTWNIGVRMATGQLVLRLDPDDYLVDDAVEKVYLYSHLADSPQVCGIVFLTKFDNGEIVGYHPYKGIVKTNFIDYRLKDNALGDRLEICKRSAFMEFPMPEIDGEKFCLESVMWQHMAEKYDACYIPFPIYVREYNDASITSNLTKVLRANPQGTRLAYAQYIKVLTKAKERNLPVTNLLVRNGINYFRFALSSPKTRAGIFREIPSWVSWLTFVPGCILFMIDSLFPNLVYNVLNRLRGTVR